MRTLRDVRAARYRDRPTGLAAFLGRISGVELIRKTLHRYEDGKRLKVYREHRAELKTRHAGEVRTLETRLNIQAQETGRKAAGLEKVERRELAAFMRDQRTEQRVRDRGGDDTLPSLTAVLDAGRNAEAPAPDLLSSFAKAKQSSRTSVPDLMSAFERAAGGRDASDAEEGSHHSGPDGYAAPDGPSRHRLRPGEEALTAWR